ncbi:MAG TPA: 4Fe-4S binding protein [Treponemataceae bacterium]|nr:4Fe-4S binding protein [Treponemataceae bacterium]
MAVKVLLSALMAFVIYFFTISMHGANIITWIYGAFLLYLFISMIFTGNINKYRRIFQLVFAVLFTISFIGNLYDERGSMAITQNALFESEIPFCHLVIPVSIIPYALTKTIIFPARITGHYAAIVSMLVIWLTAALTIGRGWCSWACFYGGLEDGFSGIAKKQKIKLLPKSKEIRYFHFAFFSFLILMGVAFLSSIFCEWFCPFKLITEFTPIVDIPSLIATFIFMSVFLIFIVILPILTKKRTQCSMLCPFGAMQSLLDPVSIYRVAIDTDKCTSCMQCASVCPFNAIDIDTITQKKGRPEITCAKCGACMDVCPQKAITMEYSFSKLLAKKCGTNVLNPDNKIQKFFMDLLDPKHVFMFSAFTFGVIISSSLSTDGIRRLISGLLSALQLGGN